MIDVQKMDGTEEFAQCLSCLKSTEETEIYRIKVGKTKRQTTTVKLCFACLMDLKDELCLIKDQPESMTYPNDYVYCVVDKGTKFEMIMPKSIRDLTIREIEGIDKDGYYYSTEERARNYKGSGEQ